MKEKELNQNMMASFERLKKYKGKQLYVTCHGTRYNFYVITDKENRLDSIGYALATIKNKKFWYSKGGIHLSPCHGDRVFTFIYSLNLLLAEIEDVKQEQKEEDLGYNYYFDANNYLLIV